jgi:hypothetical protein
MAQGNPTSHTLTIDDTTISILLNSELSYEQFATQILNDKILRKKMLLLAGLNNKLARLEKLDSTIDELSEHIKNNMSSLSTDDTLKYYELLSSVYSADVHQLRMMFSEFIKLLTK